MHRLAVPRRLAAALVIALVSLVGVSACSSDSSSSTGAASLDITVRGSQITPNAERINVGVGKTFTLNIDSDREGKIHVHSTPEQEFDFPAGTSSIDIVVDKPGSVEIEEHADDIVIATLLVQ